MTRCLDEAKLQNYFDGELSIESMESVTSHLGSCATCAAAARELEEESALLTKALSAEFDASVPTERLRQRIDAAVLGERVAHIQTEKRSGLAAFFNGLFGTQRILGYAGLAAIVAFAAIVGVVMMKREPAPVTQPQSVASNQAPQVNPPQTATPAVAQSAPASEIAKVSAPSKSKGGVTPHFVKAATTPAPKIAPVKLLPGERSYLQTIAKLDSTIESGKKAMRPSLRVEYERNLAVVDRAIAATRSAAKSKPNDPDAADFMFAAYQSKVDLLNTIADARVGGH